jgi:exosortase D (VPLPA-CTERM-specific)
VLLLSAIPLAVMMNSVRIGIIGIMVDRYGIEQAEGFLHLFEGWVIFLSCIAILFGMAKLMQRLSGDRRPLGEALELDFSGLGHQIARVRDTEASRGLITAACLTAAIAAAWMLAPSRDVTMPERDPFSLFPRQIGDWTGTSGVLDPTVEEVLRADDYLAAFYRSPDEAAGVDFFMTYYERQTNGAAVHSPAACLPGAGWEVFSIDPVTVSLPGTGFGSFELNRALIQKGLEKQLVYYWFEGHGRRLTGDFAVKFYTVADGMTMGRSDGGLVRVITAVGPEPDGVAQADARLQRFLADAVDRLPRFIPE